MEAGGPAPLYIQVIQWADVIIKLANPVAIVIILALALIKFWQLVDHIAPKPQNEAELKKARSEAK